MKPAQTQETPPTVFEKVEKHITEIAEKYGATIEKSLRSRYFKFNGRVLRLSNHIGKNSSGAISIIVPNGSNGDEFILHIHSTGSVKTINARQLREFVDVFVLVSDFLEPMVNTVALQNVQKYAQQNENNTILGYSQNQFTEAQLNQINLFIQQNRIGEVQKSQK